MDVQREDVPSPIPYKIYSRMLPSHDEVWRAWEMVRNAQRPLILIGGGIRSSLAQEALIKCLNHAHIPVVHSLMGVDCLPASHPLRVGMIGSYGNRWANLAVAEADLLLVLGSRLDVRQTGSSPNAFASGKKIIHVDCDVNEIGNRVAVDVRVVSDLGTFLAASSTCLADSEINPAKQWVESIGKLRRKHPDTDECHVAPGAINPNWLMQNLSKASTQAVTVSVDVGQHQMWAAQSWEPVEGQRFITSGGMGSMGFALPAAIGAACAKVGEAVLVIAGDGGFQCNIQELQTIRRCNLPIKMVVINNHCHGMVRQFQESYFSGRYQSTLEGYSAPSFAAVAQAYQIPSRHIKHRAEVLEALNWLWHEPKAPSLLEIDLPTMANVYPKLAFGRNFPAMEPEVSPLEMEGT
jgi:acetolactate synthase-1/2/3 large subunit